MAAERYLSRRIPDLRVGNNIDEIDKKLIPASIHPWKHLTASKQGWINTGKETCCMSINYMNYY